MNRFRNDSSKPTTNYFRRFLKQHYQPLEQDSERDEKKQQSNLITTSRQVNVHNGTDIDEIWSEQPRFYLQSVPIRTQQLVDSKL